MIPMTRRMRNILPAIMYLGDDFPGGGSGASCSWRLAEARSKNRAEIFHDVAESMPSFSGIGYSCFEANGRTSIHSSSWSRGVSASYLWDGDMERDNRHDLL